MGAEGKSERTAGAYIGSIVALAIMLFVANRIPSWDWRFITDDYPAVLWALNLSILVQLAGNAILVFVHPRFLHYLAQTVFNIVSLLALVILTSVFPIDFSYLVGNAGNTALRIVLIIATVGTGIGVVVNLFKTIGSLVRRAE